jgi:hypothetical protein
MRIVGTRVEAHVSVLNATYAATVWSGGNTLSQCALTGWHLAGG